MSPELEAELYMFSAIRRYNYFPDWIKTRFGRKIQEFAQSIGFECSFSYFFPELLRGNMRVIKDRFYKFNYKINDL